MKISALYVEHSVRDHPRTLEILARLPKVPRVDCARWSEVFNRRAQSFRLQKRRPGLILAGKEKDSERVLPTPAGYGIGQERNFYFSHLLNCPYDCRYCFLQGMYRSAHYVLFVDYEGFFDAARREIETGGPACFFSGYDADSLALEGLTGFAGAAVEAFRGIDGATLELRTKSTLVAPLLAHEAYDRCVVAWSFTPDAVSAEVEHGVPTVERRLGALRQVAERGWPIGLRFDPILACEDFEARYVELFDRVFATLGDLPDALHSVSLGPFRLPAPFFRRLERLHGDDPLIAGGPWESVDGTVSYRRDLERRMVGFCLDELGRRVPSSKLYPCPIPGSEGASPEATEVSSGVTVSVG